MSVRVPNYSRDGIVGTNRKSKGIMGVWDTTMGGRVAVAIRTFQSKLLIKLKWGMLKLWLIVNFIGRIN